MTARPPFDEHDALDPEERELASRLSAFDAGGPSSALDARILAAARAAASAPAPVQVHRAAGRRTRRWPTAIGAVATLVVAVGLAWQLKPLVDVPPPLRREVASAASDDVEVLAQAARVPAAAAESAPSAASMDAASPPPVVVASAPARAPSALGNRASTAVAKAQPQARQELAVAPVAGDFVDEAVGDHSDAAGAAAVAAAAAPPAPPAPPAAVAVEERSQRVDARASARTAESDSLDRVTVSGSRIPPPPVSADAALAPLDWLARIRERRDSGDIDGARESLKRFVRQYPRHRLPDDLRELRAPPR